MSEAENTVHDLMREMAKNFSSKQDLYSTFLMPWNVAKAEKMEVLDRILETLIQEIVNHYILNETRLKEAFSLMTEKSVNLESSLQNEKLHLAALKNSLNDTRKELESLHVSYEEVVATNESLQKELENARTKKSRKRNS